MNEIAGKRKAAQRSTIDVNFQGCDVVTAVTHTNTRTKVEKKRMALASEQNQETGTVANLCAADQANASVNRTRD